MNTENTLITVERQALLDAVIELEHRYTVMVFKLLDAVTRVESACQNVHDLLADNSINQAKQDLFKLLFADLSPLEGDAMDTLLDDWYQNHRKKHDPQS